MDVQIDNDVERSGVGTSFLKMFHGGYTNVLVSLIIHRNRNMVIFCKLVYDCKSFITCSSSRGPMY